MAIGQILETLVRADVNGNIGPGLAQSWTISRDALTIHFRIRSNAQFSNGRIVRPKDILYSINRFRLAPNSQSYSLLENIKSIFCDDYEVTLVLYRPQLSIFKILSRDQLGIVPDQWHFDPKAHEPYVGSGPYRLIRKNSDWFYVANHKSFQKGEIKIKTWRLIFAPQNESAPFESPDYIPAIAQESVERFRKRNVFSAEQYVAREQISFVQNLAWWHPRGRHYQNSVHRHIKMGLIRELMEQSAAKLGRPRATGIIPIGVAGFLPYPETFEPITANQISKVAIQDASIRNLSVAVGRQIQIDNFDPEVRRNLELKYGVQIQIQNLDSDHNKVALPIHVDVAIDRWAGGFNDPEGFIPLIVDLIGISIKEYFGSDYLTLQKASSELEGRKRSAAFRGLNQNLVRRELVVPGWKTPTFWVLNRNFKKSEKIFYQYTPRLTEIEERL